MSSIWSRKTLAIFLLFLPGCLSMSNTEKKENLITYPLLEKSREKGINSGVFLSGNWPELKWWESFQSPVLNKWIETALFQNPSLTSVQSRVNQASEAAKVSRAKLMPTLFFNASDNYRYFSDNQFYHLLNPSLPLNGYEVDLSLAFNYEFDFWNRNRNLFRAAIGELKALEAEYQEAELILATALTQAYFALLVSFKKEELYQELYEVRLARFNLQESLKQSALLSSLPPLLSDEEVKEAKQLVLEIQDEIEIQSHLINILMGRGPDEELEKGSILENPPSVIPLPVDLSVDLLSRRPDLMAQIWKAESLAAEVGAARADFFPNINLAALAGLASTAWSSLFNLGAHHSLSYVPSLSLPIFTAGAIRANIQAKKAAFDQAIFQYNDLLLKSAQEVSDLLSNVQTVYKQKELQEGVVANAKYRLDLTSLRKKSGLDSAFAVFNYEEELIRKQITNVDYTYQQYAFLVKLIKALGGGYLYSDVPISLKEDHE